MTWLARRRLTTGLLRLGHWPQWRRRANGERYASCRDCPRGWGGDVIRWRNVANTLYRTGACNGRR